MKIYDFFVFFFFVLIPVILMYSIPVLIFIKSSHFDRNDSKGNFLIILGSTISILFIFFSIWAPQYFTSNVSQKYGAFVNEAAFATMINGLMSPFIAISAAIATFLAFFVQYQANKKMLVNNEIQQEERQFYEMLHIHRDNVEKLEWVVCENPIAYKWYVNKNVFPLISDEDDECLFTKVFDNRTKNGQKAIRLFFSEFLLILKMVSDFYGKRNNITEKIVIAYEIFFEGLTNSEASDELKVKLQKIRGIVQRNSEGLDIDEHERSAIENDINLFGIPYCIVFNGHRDVLNSYYRHLYYTVKYVANSKRIENCDDKMNYLKILRAQLTSEEQVMLYLNWLSGYGKEWETDNEHHFFTEYMMIHNVTRGDLDKIYGKGKGENKFFESLKVTDEQKKCKILEFVGRPNKLRNM